MPPTDLPDAVPPMLRSPAFAPRHERAVAPVAPGEAGPPPLGVHVRAALQAAHSDAVAARDRAREQARRAAEEFRAAQARLEAAADRELELRHFLRLDQAAHGVRPVALSDEAAARAMGPGSDRPVAPADLGPRP